MALLSQVPALRENVDLEERDGECSLYDPSSGTVVVFENEVARRIAREIARRTPAAEICGHLEREFPDVPLTRIQSDVEDMLRILEQHSLIYLFADNGG